MLAVSSRVARRSSLIHRLGVKAITRANHNFPTGDFKSIKRDKNEQGEKKGKAFMYLVIAAAGVGIVAVAKDAVGGLFSTLKTPANIVFPAEIFDISEIKPGEHKLVLFNKQPYYIMHRTPEEIKSAQEVDNNTLMYPEPDSSRVQKDEWLVVTAACPCWNLLVLYALPNPSTEEGSFFCWRCTARFDLSGRLLKKKCGSAGRNLPVPHYSFTDANTLKFTLDSNPFVQQEPLYGAARK